MGSTKFKLVVCHSWFLLLLALESTAKIGFYSQNEYRYEYIGQVRTGLPNVGKDKTAVGIISTVLVQPTGSDLVVQLSDIRTFTGFVENHEETINEIPLNYKQLQDQTDLRRPFKITYHQNSDKFKGIEVSNKDTPASINIKKALAVFLNVRLDQQLSKRQGYFAASSPTANFEPIDVDESGIEGICTTKYIYQQQPWPGNHQAHVLNVTKIRDAQSCEEEPIWRTSIQEAQKCSSCESQHASFINHGSVAHYNVYEENGQYVLQEAENHGQADVTPFPPEGDKVRITQFQKLKLIEIRRASGRAPNLEPSVQEPSMTIVPEEMNLQARYKRYTKTSGTKISPLKVVKEPYKKEDPKTKVKKWLDVLSSKPFDSKGEVLDQIPDMVSNTRALTYEEIQEIYESIRNQEDKKKLFIDVVVMTGTDASIIFIKYLLEQGKITGEDAAQVISALPAYILEPKPAILEELWALCKGRMIKENRQIYVTTLLAFGELVNQACVPKLRPKSVKPYHVKVGGCPKALTTRYLQELMNQFEQSKHMWEKSTIMYAIYRMGLNDTLDFLIPYLQGRIFTLPSGLRSEMLIALFEVGPGRQHEIAKYILPIFYNTSLTSEERILAFEVLSYTTTSQEIMNQLALSTWHESNINVATYIYNYLNAGRKVKLPCWIPMAVRSQHAYLLAKPAPAGLLDSRINIFSNYAEKWSMGSSFTYGFLHSSKALFPKMAFVHIAKELAGYYYSPLEILTINDGMQNILDHIVGPQAEFTNKKLSDLFKYDASPTGRADSRGKEEFIVTPRKDEPVYTRIMFSYLHNRHRLFFLDQDTMKDIRNSGIIPPNKDIFDGIPINFRKVLLLEDTELKFTSLIGLPMKIDFKMPASIEVRGNITLDVAKGGIYQAVNHIGLKSDIDYSLSLNAWVGVYTNAIFDNKILAAEASGNLFASSSVNGYVIADLDRNSLTASLGKANPNAKENTILSAKIIPALVIYDKNTDAILKERIVNSTATQREKDIIVDGISGLPLVNAFVIKSTSDLPIQQERKLWRDLEKEGLLHMLSFGWAPRRFNLKTVEVVRDPHYADTQQVELSINWKHSPTPYEEELWRGKSPLQQLRLWNIIPEWKDASVSCKDVQSPVRIQATTEAPKKKSWFSRFKDKVKTTFGRSGGDSDEEDDDDDDDDAEDRGRALHPHISTGEAGAGRRAGGRSSVTSETSQPRSTEYGGSGRDINQGYSGQNYGQTHQGSGQDYGQTHHGSGQDYGQTHRGSGQDYGQTQHGSGPGYGQSQSGGDYDFEQKPSSAGQFYDGQTSYGGHGQHGGTQPPRSGSSYDSDRLKGRTALVRKLFFKDEVSTTLIAIKLNTLGATKRQITADVTVSRNAPQGIDKLSVVMDFQNVFKQQQKNIKVCLNGDYISSFIQCQSQQKTFPRFDYKLQWGDVCDNNNYVSIKGTYANGPEAPKLWQEHQAKCANDLKTGFLLRKECIQSFEDAATLTNVKYEIHYSQPLSHILTKVSKVVDGYLKCHLSDFLLDDNYHVVNNEEGLISAELNYHTKEPLVDIQINKPKESIVLKDFYYEQLSPFLQPRSTAVSYSLKLGRTLTNDKIIHKCIVGQDGIVATFNSVTYNYTLDSCQHILAKDCSSSNLFTVSLTGSQTKKIKVEILGHVIESSPSLPARDKKFEFLVDGKSDFIEDGQIAVLRSQGNEDSFLAQISYAGQHVTIKAPSLGLTIMYTQQSVLVIVSSMWKGKLCGLCGENTDDESKTFLGPDQCLYNDRTAFARSYRVQGPQCPSLGYQAKSTSQCIPLVQDQKFERIREPVSPVSQTSGSDGYDAEFVQVPGSTGFGGQTTQTEDDIPHPGVYSGQTSSGGRGSGQASDICYGGTHLIKTKHEQHCFSVEYVRQCHPSCVAADFEYKRVHFSCYSATSEKAQDMFRDAQQNKKVIFPSAGSSTSTFEEEIMLPQTCNPKY